MPPAGILLGVTSNVTSGSCFLQAYLSLFDLEPRSHPLANCLESTVGQAIHQIPVATSKYTTQLQMQPQKNNIVSSQIFHGLVDTVAEHSLLCSLVNSAGLRRKYVVFNLQEPRDDTCVPAPLKKR